MPASSPEFASRAVLSLQAMFGCYATSPGSRNWRSQVAIWEGNTPKSWQLPWCLLAGQLLCFLAGDRIRCWTHIDGFFGDRSLSSLTFNGGIEDDYGDWEEGDPVTIDTNMTEADFSGKKLGAAGAQVLAAFMSTKLVEAKGSLVSLNLAGNRIGVEGVQHVAEVLPKW
jgi:hypothetical protein